MFASDLKSFGKFIRIIYCKRVMSNSHKNSEIISDLIGIPKTEALLYVEKLKMKDSDPENISEVIRYCQKLGFPDQDILNTPGLLKVGVPRLEQHHLSLEEGGFHTITAKVLIRAFQYMKKQVCSLKADDFIKKEDNVVLNFLSYIKDPYFIDCFDQEKAFGVGNLDDLTWTEIHSSILQAYLKHRLKATDDEIIRLFRIHKMIKNKSFRTIQENISIAEGLGFQPWKILKCGYLLHNYPNYTKTTLRDLSNLAGGDMKKAMKHYPKLIMVSPKSIIKIYGILKEFEIEDEVVQKRMNIFYMSPETVRVRLEAIQNDPDLKVLLKHPRCLSLVVHHKRARSRLSYLQQLKLKCASFSLLETDRINRFEDYVRGGKDMNMTKDITSFLGSTFSKTDADLLYKKLRLHPFYLHVPLKEMQNTYNFLIGSNFQQTHIKNAIWILLYPVEKVKQTISDIMNTPSIHYRSLNRTDRINLMLYMMEKQHHFTGNGIWKDSELEELQHKTLE